MTYLIGDPSLQDTGEMEWPLYHNDVLVDFFPNIPAAVRAGDNLDAIADCAAGNTDDENNVCGDCGSVLGDLGFCEDCSDREIDDLDLIAGDVGGVVAYVNGRRT